MILNKLHSIFYNDLNSIDQVISNIANNNSRTLKEVILYMLHSNGKKLRPLLFLLITKIFNHDKKDYLFLAAAIEGMHIASLLHDDVIDAAIKRRFQESPNIIWGNKVSVLSGDFILSQIVKLIVSKNFSRQILLSFLDAIAKIVNGEVIQMESHNRIILEDNYYQVIENKTGALFASSCAIAAIISGQNEKTKNQLEKFGLIFGTIYQIIDDLMDYIGKSTGKEVGIDLARGNITLPIIMLYNQSNSEEKVFLEQSIKNKSKDRLNDILHLFKKYNIKAQILEICKQRYHEAKDILNNLPQNNFTDYLNDLLIMIMNSLNG